MKRYVLAEGAISVAGNSLNQEVVSGSIGGEPLSRIVEQAEALGVKCGQEVRLVIEVDEPKIVFPTGTGWGKPYETTEGRWCVSYTNSYNEKRFVCLQYPDGKRVLDQVSDGRWRDSLPALAIGCAWANRKGEFEEKP